MVAKYAEKVVATLITVVLFGALVWAFGHFTAKIENLERNIVAHHGPQWDQIERIVAVEKLRGDVSQLQSVLEGNLGRRLQAVESWIQASDEWIEARRSTGYEAYAHLSKAASAGEDVALLNTAHASAGTRFEIGDEIVVKRTDSTLAQQVRVTISGAYADLENSDVLVQLARKPADLLGLSERLGKIRVLVRRDQPEPGSQGHRMKLKDYREKLGLTRTVAGIPR